MVLAVRIGINMKKCLDCPKILPVPVWLRCESCTKKYNVIRAKLRYQRVKGEMKAYNKAYKLKNKKATS